MHSFRKQSARKLRFETLEDRRVLATYDFDTSFGTNGVAESTYPFPASGSAFSTAVQPDGKTVVGSNGTEGSVVVRFDANGKLDTTFDGDGKFHWNLDGLENQVRKIDVAPDGKIVVVGEVNINGAWEMTITRINPNGGLDTSFSSFGFRRYSYLAGSERSKDVHVMEDGKILVLGTYTSPNFGESPIGVRFTTSGAIDTTFGGGDGLFLFGSNPPRRFNALEVQPDGKILLAGSYNGDMHVIRMFADGTNDDASFANSVSGSLIDFGTTTESAVDLAIQPDGKVLVIGSANGGYAVARLTTIGTLDSTFDTDGKRSIDISQYNDTGVAIDVLPDNRIIAVGTSQALIPNSSNTQRDIALVRLNPNGSNDSSLNGNGILVKNISVHAQSGNNFHDNVADVMINADGKVIVGGTSDYVINNDITVVRFNEVSTMSISGTSSYTEGQEPVLIASNSSLTDPDNPSFPGGELRVQISSEGEATDVLSVVNQGTGSGQIGVTGNTVTYGGVPFGTITGGTNQTPMTVSLNQAASTAAVQALLRNLAFHSTSVNPSAKTRNITYAFHDGNGGTSLPQNTDVVVIPVNVNPVLTVSGNYAYTENGTPVLIGTGGNLVDGDGGDFDGGNLRVWFQPNRDAVDLLSVRNQGTAAGQIGLNGTSVTFGGTEIGILNGGTANQELTITLNAQATIVATEALVRNITFSNLGDRPSTASRVVGFQLMDGDGGSSESSFVTIAVTPVNDAPTIGLLGPDFTYIENGIPIRLTTTGTVTDPDSSNLDLGKLTVMLSVNAKAEDRLTIVNAGAISVVDDQVLHSQVVIGTFTGGVGTTPLVVNFNANASPTRVQSLIRTITYSNVSENPSSDVRTLTFQITDGDGGISASASKSIFVSPRNDLPVIGTVGPDLSFVENGAPIRLTTTATISDLDRSDFNTGRLTVLLSVNAKPEDRLTIINAGAISVVNNEVFFNGVALGTFTGGVGTTPLVVTLNATATPSRVQSLIRTITYSNVSENPSSVVRTLTFRVSDGDGGTSASVSKSIAVTPGNDAPVIGAIGPDLSYVENGAPIRLTTTGTVTDVDSANLDQGKLTVLFTVNAKSEDRLTIINAGAVSVSGSQAFFSGVAMGTFTGGVGTTPLVVTLNSTATPTKVQSLIRSITYSNVSENPSAATRTLTFRLTDGDGGTSANTSKFINVTPRNDGSILGGIDGTRNYVNNTAGILIATTGASTIATATVNDFDSPDFDQGRLTIVATAGGHSSNRIELSGTVFTLDASNNVLRNGTIIGTLNANGGVGTTRFEVTFNAQATPAVVQQLLRVIKFRTTTNASVAQRVFSFTLTDGDGGTSNVLSKTINVA